MLTEVRRRDVGVEQSLWDAEHKPARSPVGQMKKGIEVLFNPPIWITLEVSPVVFVDKTGRRDLPRLEQFRNSLICF